ncbi:MAG: precorrin-8X methylmutase [Sulfolobus sp.]|nr:precorrin-8X methylmutase [Sulfolobus sp.]
MSSSAIVVVTHGSRRKEFLEDLEKISDALKGLNAEVILAHNEYSFPNWREVLRDLVERGYDRIVFALAFLGRGNHVFRDIAGSLGIDTLDEWKEVEVEGRKISVYLTRPLADSALVQSALRLRVMKALDVPKLNEGYVEDPEEIESRSMRIAEEEALRRRPELNGIELKIAARLIYASGNPEIVNSLYVSRGAIDVALEALKAEASLVADVRMVHAGLRWSKKLCALDFADREAKRTVVEDGMRRALETVDGLKAVVVGNAPTALLEALRQVKQGKEVAFFIATPPGFTNAEEIKEELIKSGLPSLVVRGTLGGSNLAVAIANELVRWAR